MIKIYYLIIYYHLFLQYLFMGSIILQNSSKKKAQSGKQNSCYKTNFIDATDNFIVYYHLFL